MTLKKTCIITSVLLLILCFSACSGGSYVSVMSTETNNAQEISMEYDSFDGNKFYDISIEQEVIVTVHIETESGSMSAYIAKDNDVTNAVYQGSDIPTSDFTVALTESGTYTIRVDANQHSGSYSFQWESSYQSTKSEGSVSVRNPRFL